MIYQFIKYHQRVFPIEKMCKVLSVSLRSYYDWKSGSISDRRLRATMFKKKIKDVYYDEKQRYGSSRIATVLQAQGDKISRVTVAEYMKEMGLLSKLGRKFRTTADSKHSHMMMENVLDREFTVSEASKVWVSDITYIHTREGFLYLTTIIDLYDRKCIGWSINNGMSAEET